MKHGSLFSGIGGFDLAAEWMGWENVFHCEINEFCQKILKYHFPDAKSYTDIKTTDFTFWRGRCDIITGGFPCQPYSNAGKRKGKADDRHLWPQMLRTIREIQPRWVVGENVSGLLNWNKGLVLDEIKVDLETTGFEVFPPLVLPACAVNAPHRRDRVWIIAHNNNAGNIPPESKGVENGEKNSEEREHPQPEFNRHINVTHPDQKQFVSPIPKDRSVKNDKLKKEIRGDRWREFKLVAGLGYSQTDFYNGFDFEPTIIRTNNGLSTELDELEAYGNAVVPQVVFEIFKTIELYESNMYKLRS